MNKPDIIARQRCFRALLQAIQPLLVNFAEVNYWYAHSIPSGASVAFSGTFQSAVDGFQETSGGSRMLIQKPNLCDASRSSTTQRQHDEVHQTPRFRAPDPY